MSKSKNESPRPATAGTKSTGKPVAPWVYVATSLAIIALAMYLPSLLLAGITAKVALLIAFPEGQIRSGRSGTAVFMKNNVQRIWKYPKLVRNSMTTAIRGSLSSLSSAYASLSPDIQASYMNAVGYTKVNRIGNTIILQGKALFVKLSQNCFNIGITGPGVCPLYQSIKVPTLSSAPVLSATSNTLTIVPDATNAADGTVLMATAQLSAGVNRPSKNKFRIIKSWSDQTSAPAADVLYDAYVAKFGVPAIGATIFLKLYAIGNSTSSPGGHGNNSGETQVYKITVT